MKKERLPRVPKVANWEKMNIANSILHYKELFDREENEHKKEMYIKRLNELKVELESAA